MRSWLTWLTALFVWLCALPAAADRSQVRVVQSARPNPLIEEALVRLLAEIKDVGFETRLQRAGQPAVASAIEPFATIAFGRSDGKPRVEVWLSPALGLPVATHYVAIERDARTLAIRAVELLRASLLDAVALADDAPQLPADVASWIDAREPAPPAVSALRPTPGSAAGDGNNAPQRETKTVAQMTTSARSQPTFRPAGSERRGAPAPKEPVARPLLAAGTGGLMPTGGWPAAWVISMRASYPVSGNWSLGTTLAATPKPTRLVSNGVEARLQRELYSLLVDYTLAAPDAWVVPRVALTGGALHAHIRGSRLGASVDGWAFATGAHAGIAFHLTRGLALYTDAGLLFTWPPLHVPVTTQFKGDTGVLSGMLQAGTAARF